MGYFDKVKNQIEDKVIAENYYIKSLSKGIVSYYENEHNENRKVFELIMKHRLKENFKEIEDGFIDIYNKASNYLK